MSEERQVFVDLTKAPRDKVILCFQQQRDEILARIIRFRGETDSYNRSRFEDDPMLFDLDFTRQLNFYDALPQEEQSRVYGQAFDLLDRIENGF